MYTNYIINYHNAVLQYTPTEVISCSLHVLYSTLQTFIRPTDTEIGVEKFGLSEVQDSPIDARFIKLWHPNEGESGSLQTNHTKQVLTIEKEIARRRSQRTDHEKKGSTKEIERRISKEVYNWKMT